MTAEQMIERIDATLDAVRRNEERFHLTAGGVIDGGISMRWRPHSSTASGPGWLQVDSEPTDALPVTFREIAERERAERAAVEPVRTLLDLAFSGHHAAMHLAEPGERSHFEEDARAFRRSMAYGPIPRRTPVTRGEAAQPKGFWAVLRRLINIGRK